MDLRKWLQNHSIKLLAIRDTPTAIAGGVAIGIFFGFTPLIGLKTLLSIFVAWIFGWNLLAAALAVTLHDLALPFMPFIFRLEYDIGFWLLSNPHVWPTPVKHLHLFGADWLSWTKFITIGMPLLVGSLIIATPAGVASFFLTRAAVLRHNHKKAVELAAALQAGEPKEKDLL